MLLLLVVLLQHTWAEVLPMAGAVKLELLLAVIPVFAVLLFLVVLQLLEALVGITALLEELLFIGKLRIE